MLKFASLLALGAFPLALGQYGTPAGGDSSSASAAPSATTSANPNIHTVSVGQGGFIFTPNTTVASVGQQVEFQFFPPNHTVTQSSFENPCQPLNSTSFFSGFMVTQDSPSVRHITTQFYEQYSNLTYSLRLSLSTSQIPIQSGSTALRIFLGTTALSAWLA